MAAGFSVLKFDARNHGQIQVGQKPFILETMDDAPGFVAAVEFMAQHPEYANNQR